MTARIDEIAPDLYRISVYVKDFDLQFNHFLIKDDEPLLFHTGMRRMFPEVREAVARLIDPAALRWISWSHFEVDECGALNEWLKVAPQAEAVCSVVGAIVMVNDFADRAPRPLADNEVLNTGSHRLRFLSTPHVPHCWDAGLFFEEVNELLLCSDLFFHPGNPEPLAGDEVLGRAQDSIVQNLAGPLAKDMPYTPYTDDTLRRIAALKPRTMGIMHGSSFQGDGAAAIQTLAGFIKQTIGERK